ncbi:MAG: RNA polymerase subunit sigma-24, partial [Saccharothrix sp.]|nr:RNA polymerase subunit sigma-24 [Saccharothrix sp.]
ERLSPLERAVFVLREVFGFGFTEVAAAVGRSEAACRQLAVRARRHMDAGRPRFEADRREREELAGRFFDAFREGDVDGLRELLAADVRLVGDSGGKAPQWQPAFLGVANVVGALTALVLDGRIQTIRTVINPDKLGHVGPVADAWAVLREAGVSRGD